MLTIVFINDSTGDEKIGNYNWGVFINKTLLAKGELKGHNRLTGWEGLVKQFSKDISFNTKRGKK
jgi:hypothetical protein